MKSNSKRKAFQLTAIVAGLMVLLASCGGGHGGCGAYGNPKTNNTNAEHMAE